jgi:uncharacterized membrane-anchored protein YjiN (DUF445 family)
MTRRSNRRRSLPSDRPGVVTGGSNASVAMRYDQLPRDRARQMRRVATLLLVAMACLFVLAWQMQGQHPAWGYVRAFAEAAMVGGLADWFAVTALFRHPMGIPIPHTAIIPENKDRIADTMAQFLRANFLTPAVVGRRMRDLNVAQAAGDFLVRRGEADAGRIRAGAAELFVELLESLDPQRLGMQVKAGLARQVEKIEIAPLLGQMLEAAIADGRHRPLIDGVIRWAGLALEDNEALVRDMVQARANALLRWTGLDDRLANSVLDGLYRLLAEVAVDPQHPLRARLDEGLQTLARDLQADPATRAKVEKLKNELIGNAAVSAWWMGIWERIRLSLIATARDPHSALSGQFGASLAELGEALRADPRLQVQVNRFARRTLVGVATRYGDQIVALVSGTVKRWDGRTISGRIEGAVGRDLQFIRINGTLVGGLVGVTIHLVTQLF